MGKTPYHFDIKWLGCLGIEELARRGSREGEPAWMNAFWAWLVSRLKCRHPDLIPRGRNPLSKRDESGFSPKAFPILSVTVDSDPPGVLGMVELVRAPERGDENTNWEARALELVRAFLGRLESDVPQREAVITIQGRPVGGSAALACMCAALLHYLDVPNSHEAAATGCLTCEGGPARLAPVKAATLPAKIACARRFGYGKLLVVQGQDGIADHPGIEIVEIPRDPALAIPVLLRHLVPYRTELKVADVLAALDEARVRSGMTNEAVEEVLAVTECWIDGGVPGLVRSMAHEVRGNALRHVGRGAEASREAELASGSRQRWLPESPRLHDYLRWHKVAHLAIQAIDGGRWDRADGTWQELDDAIRDISCPRTLREAYAFLALHNARARHRLYLGRFEGDIESVRGALDDYLRLQDAWEDIWEFAARMGIETCTAKRQHNQIIEVLDTLRHLGVDAKKIRPDLPPLWVENAGFKGQDDPFDIVALLTWYRIQGRPLEWLEIHKMGEREPSPGFPSHLVWEGILRSKDCDSTSLHTAAARLRDCEYLRPNAKASSILSILALRTRAVLRLSGQKGLGHISRPESGPLGALFDQLEPLDDSEIVWRCPY